MKDTIDFLENGDYRLIINLINDKLPVLKSCKQFNEQYNKFFDTMEELEETLDESQKEKFNELIRLVYSTEEYYFAFIYSLGVKYGQDLERI